MAKITKSDYKFFELARQEALKSNYEPHHLGCVIVYKNRVVSTGYNSTKTHSVQKKYNRKYRHFREEGKPFHDSLHAEMSALLSLAHSGEKIDFSKVKIYIYRIAVGLPLHMGLSRPCPACRHALLDAGIHHVYYTTDTGYCYEEMF